MIKPNYSLEGQKRLFIAGQRMSLLEQGDKTYLAINETDGTSAIWSYNEAISFLKMSDTSAGYYLSSMTKAAARARDGGKIYKETLSERLQDQIDFRKAMLLGVDALENTGVEISAVNLDQEANRRFIEDVAGKIYTKHPIRPKARGGSIKLTASLPEGRVILDYRERYVDSGYNEIVLADQEWLRGNRTNHGVSDRMRALMTQAIEEVFLDTKSPNIAAALRWLKTLVTEENVVRAKNGLDPLKAVCHETMSRHAGNIGATALTIARDGERAATNKRLRGLTDVRALKVAELVEVDECKLSLITVCKKKGWWERFSEKERETVEEIEEIIRTRLWLVLVLDVATKMPLGWVLSDKVGHEAALEALRMATRDKTKEKIIYQCDSDPMPAVGIGAIKTDNGSGLRNVDVKAASLGILAQSIDCRSYNSAERPHVERFFGSLESIVFNLVHGYTGRKAGHLKGYDPIKSGVFDTEELYGIITRYLIDEYPFERHFGSTMRGMRPIQAAKDANEQYGCVAIIPPLDRRIHLGWKSEATVTDEGVKAFGIPYSSPELQKLSDAKNRKVTVYSDPDCVDEVTVLIEGRDDPILGVLSWTALKGMSVPEALEFGTRVRAEDPSETHDFERRLARARRRRRDDVHSKGLEENIPKSFMTIKEAKAKAAMMVYGQDPHQRPLPNTTPPGMVASEAATIGVHDIGGGFDDVARSADQEGVDRAKVDDSFDLGKPDIEGKLK